MKLGCVVMAAGSGSRFGANKLLQDFRGKPLCRWALEAVPAAEFSGVCVVTGYEPVEELARGFGFRTVWNWQPEAGISRTIRLGLEQLADCCGVLFMTADQPLLTAASVARLTEAFRETPEAIVAASCGGRRGNPCIFPRTLFPELLTLQGDVGGSAVIRTHGEQLRLVELPARELADCDTAQALHDLERSREC